MKRYFTLALAISLAVILTGCGADMGGSEAGNPLDPGLRAFVGTLESGAAAAQVAKTTSACIADELVAMDSLGVPQTADVRADCTFELPLPIDRAYTVALLINGLPTAYFIFLNGPDRLPSSIMYVSAGASPIDVGSVFVDGDRATVTHEPSLQNDRDGDGYVDYDDLDDDDDGIPDDDEQNCDLDQFIDDDDEESSCAPSVTSGTPQILEVRPVHEEGITEGTEPVDLDESIEVRFSCAIDPLTVTPSSFQITSSTDTIPCDLEYSNSGRSLTCKHPSRDFLPVTIYTATIDGIECIGSGSVQKISWSWMTGNED